MIHMLLVYFAILITYSASFLLLFILDYYIANFRKYKIQNKFKSLEFIDDDHVISNKKSLMNNWTSGIPISLFNLFITIPTCLVISMYNCVPTNEFVFVNECLNLIGFTIFAELWFYTFHYISHMNFIYKYFHKMHHKYTSPVAINALYAHPLDFFITSVMSICIGPSLITAHIYTYILYTIVVVMINAFSHSGYNIKILNITLFSAKFHDDHHYLFNYNYGYGIFLDKLCNTEMRDKYIE